MSYTWSVLLICNILTTVCTQQSNSQVNVYYVKPEEIPAYVHCPTSHCHTLAVYVSNASRYFVSNTELIFLPGTHILQGNTSRVHIANVTNLSLRGNSTRNEANQQSIIVCNGPGGITFANASVLTIEHLVVTKCGQMVPSSDTQAALAFQIVYNLTVSGITVYNNSGFGMYAERVFGDSWVVDSVFRHNYGTISKCSGNAIFWYEKCTDATIASKSLLNIGYSSFYTVALFAAMP